MNWERYNLQKQLTGSTRATIVPSMTKSSPRKGKKRGRKTKQRKGKSSFRLVKGRVAIRVPGFNGVQKFSPSRLIQHVNKTNLRQAAKVVLNKSKGSKSRKGRKRRRKNRKIKS